MDCNKFAKLVTEHESMLYHIAKSILKHDFDCADAVQEALLKAFRNLGSLREEKYFKTWICKILIRECYKIHGYRKNSIPFDDYMANERYESDSKNTELYYAIMKLSDKHRLAVTLHYIEGFKTSEIAKMIKVPEGTIKSRLSKARSELKTLLSEIDVKEEPKNEMGQCISECSGQFQRANTKNA